MPLKKFTYQKSLLPSLSKPRGALLDVFRHVNITVNPVTANAHTFGSFCTLNSTTTFFCPIYIPSSVKISGLFFRTSSQTSVWSQGTNIVNHSLKWRLCESDPISGLPSNFIPKTEDSASIPSSQAINSGITIGSPLFLPIMYSLKEGLYWLAVKNANSTGVEFSLAGTAPSSGERTSTELLILDKMLGASSTSSLRPYGLALEGTTGFGPSISFSGSVASATPFDALAVYSTPTIITQAGSGNNATVTSDGSTITIVNPGTNYKTTVDSNTFGLFPSGARVNLICREIIPQTIKLQYNTSASSPSFFRMRTNVPFVGLIYAV